MRARLPNLTWLRTFEAAARLLNFTAAGKELGLTQTAVSLHVKALEDTLGCKLFNRNPRRLALTDMGQAYAVAVRKGIGDLGLATVSLFGSSDTQTITVRAPISTVTLWLAPRLPAFLDAHPNIKVRLISTIWASSVSDGDVDVDLRFGHGDWPGVKAERISTETIVPIGPARSTAAITSPDELSGGPLIQILGYDDSWRNYFAAHGMASAQTDMRHSVDTTAAAVALVAASGGYAVIVSRLAEQAIEAGCPIAIVGDPIAFPQAHFLIGAGAATANRPEVEIFKEWLRAAFDDRAQ